MRGLKYIFNSWKRMSVFLTVFTAVLGAAFAVLPFVMHQPPGDEDYIFPKTFMFFASVFMTTMGMICGCRDLAMNKLVRSLPIAKELYTRAVPTFIVILSAGLTVVLTGAYFVFLSIIGAEAGQFSDTLIIGAVLCGSVLIFMPLFVHFAGGGLLGIYPPIMAVTGVMLFCGKEVQQNGFGIPLPVSAAVFAAVMILGSEWAFWISAVKFRRTDVKINNVNIMNN